MPDKETDELLIVPVTADEAKRAIAAYSSQSHQVTAELYAKFARFKAEYWPGGCGDGNNDQARELPDAVLAVMPEMNNKRLAHYQDKNGYQIPHAIELNYNFIALNWADDRVIELPDRTIVDHVLLHEMIHLYQDAVLGEQHDTQKAAHGRSFRREAKRLGLAGKGRLMSCPYVVKMPPNPNKAKAKIKEVQDESGGDDQDELTTDSRQSSKQDPRSDQAAKKLAVGELLEQLEERAAEQLDDAGFERFYHHLKAAESIIKGLPAPHS